MNITKRYSDNVNYDLNIILWTKLSYFLLKILLKNYRKKTKLADSNAISQQARQFLNKLGFPGFFLFFYLFIFIN